MKGLRICIKHSEECFILFPIHLRVLVCDFDKPLLLLSLRFVKKRLGCASFFSPNSQCLEIGLNALPRVRYMTYGIQSRAILPKNLMFNFYPKKIDLVDNSSINFSWQVGN